MTETFTSFAEFKRRYPIRPNDPGALLGSGSYGRVIKVEDQVDTEWVAIKVSEFKGNDTKSLKAEVELAQRVPRQTNIARYDACYRLETDTSISDFAIMKYYPDGNLADLLRQKSLTSVQLYDITRGILEGLQHLHRHRIVHRDFKPANILISRDNTGRFVPKIADFGLSKLVSDDELDSSDFDLSDGRGTPSYKAPEQIEGSKVSFNLDLWAFGIILYEMLTGEKPFRADPQNTSEQSVRRDIEKKIITVDLPAQLDEISEPYQAMIRRCLVRDIHERVRKEQELLDLLDRIPQLLREAQTEELVHRFEEAIRLYEQVLAKREKNLIAEKGIKHCRAELERRQISQLLTEATALLQQQQVAQAQDRYERVLKLNPKEPAAIQGLTQCIERLRPKSEPLVTETERTDVFVQEVTDVYTDPVVAEQPEPAPQPPVILESPASVELPKLPAFSEEARVVPINLTDPKAPKPFPWRMVLPLVLVAGGMAWYVSTGGKPATVPGPVTEGKTSTIEEASREKPELVASPVPVREKPVLEIIANEPKAALNKRIDKALAGARNAYKRKDYKWAMELANSALLLDPARKDVRKLRDDAIQANNALIAAADAQKVNEPVKPAPAETSTEKPATAVEDKPAKSKSEYQAEYDQLIEQGMKALGSNNKAKASHLFGNAQEQAREHGLNQAKADEAYIFTITKGNSYFERDEYEGAKGWYQVAQSLKNSDEIRRKIKLCTNQ